MGILLIGLFFVFSCGESAPSASLGSTGALGSNVVLADGRDWGNDAYVVNSARIDGDRLVVEVSFSGGCRDHAFVLVVSTFFKESDPVQLDVVLAHNAYGDPCEAWPTETHSFDLALVRDQYREFYGEGSGVVLLQIKDVPFDGLVYRFTG